jgi:hypothetical protein
MMITCIGLDLGVDTSVVINSASVSMGVKSPTKIGAFADGDGQSSEFNEVLDIRRSSNESRSI